MRNSTTGADRTCPECREGGEELAEQQLFGQNLLKVLLAFHGETLGSQKLNNKPFFFYPFPIDKGNQKEQMTHGLFTLAFPRTDINKLDTVFGKMGGSPSVTAILTPSAMRKCSPLPSVLSSTKFRKAVTFSGRVMSPSPSTPPSPGKHKHGGKSTVERSELFTLCLLP